MGVLWYLKGIRAHTKSKNVFKPAPATLQARPARRRVVAALPGLGRAAVAVRVAVRAEDQTGLAIGHRVAGMLQHQVFKFCAGSARQCAADR